jgi:hypothetical protein
VAFLSTSNREGSILWFYSQGIVTTHITVAGGAVWAVERFLRQRSTRSRAIGDAAGHSASSGEPALRTDAVDYRLVALGALLPDLIDKPLAWFLLRGAFKDDHVFGHTLLLPALLLVPGVYLARRGDWRLLSLGVATLTHVLVDPVLTYPKTLFWPLLGLEFPRTKGFASGYQPWIEAVVAAALLALMLSRRYRPRWRRLLVTGVP